MQARAERERDSAKPPATGAANKKMIAQRLRVPLGFVVAAAVLYFAQPTGISILAGLPFALVGAIFRALAAGVIKKDSSLATSGIYSLTRNPLYFGSALLAVGFAIMSADEIAATLLAVPFVLIYPRVILREEDHLERLFPNEFRKYKATVPRFFPRPSLHPRFSFSLDQYLANREYNTAMGFIGALAMFVIKWWLG
jgi:protein-S-isoprenylcysteine O-methyltransferase Ste14